jgi:hypothetical protein
VTAFHRSLLHVGCTGGPVLRALVGLLAAVGAATAVLVGLARGVLPLLMIALAAGAATGSAAYLALRNPKKKSSVTTDSVAFIQVHA